MYECIKCWSPVTWNDGWTHDEILNADGNEFDHKADHDKYKKNSVDTCYCPDCGLRRILWPLHQNVSSWVDPKAQWIHVNGLAECT